MEKNLKNYIYICIYKTESLCYQDLHNIVNQLYSN